MERTNMNSSLVDTRAERATIPHEEIDVNTDLPVRRGWFGGRFYLADRNWKVLKATIDNYKPRASWSTRLGFTFSWKNPLLSPYLQRGVNLAAITFSYFSGILPFSPKIIQAYRPLVKEFNGSRIPHVTGGAVDLIILIFFQS